MNTPHAPPYWLSGGTESCEGCSTHYVLQAELRCKGCDGAFCRHCVLVVWATREVHCATCVPEDAEG